MDVNISRPKQTRRKILEYVGLKSFIICIVSRIVFPKRPLLNCDKMIFPGNWAFILAQFASCLFLVSGSNYSQYLWQGLLEKIEYRDNSKIVKNKILEKWIHYQTFVVFFHLFLLCYNFFDYLIIIISCIRFILLIPIYFI